MKIRGTGRVIRGSVSFRAFLDESGAEELTRKISLLDVRPGASTSNNTNGILASDWRFEHGRHFFIGVSQGYGLIFIDTIGEFGAIAHFNLNQVASDEAV